MSIVVILVHGTWGKAEDAWYRRTADDGFRSRLLAALGHQGVNTDAVHFVSHEWSGGNRHADRLDGAKALSSTLMQVRHQHQGAEIHIVAHSHGGNVALKGIELYIKDSIAEQVPQLIDHRDTVETAREFLRDYKRGEFPLLTDDDRTQPLIDELSRQLDAIGRRANRKVRFSALTEGSIWDFEEGRLRHLLKRIYVLLYSYPEAHCIRSFVTMGTPFYEKAWKLSPYYAFRENLLHYASHVWFAIPLFYFYAVIFAALAALLPSVPWIGFNPFAWHWTLLLVGGAFALWFGMSFARLEAPEVPQDTNVYFDEASVAGYLSVLRGKQICRVLNVSASYLDEAYCLLSAYATLSGLLLDGFSSISRPRAWKYQRVFRQVGASPWSLPDRLRRRIRTISRMALSLIGVLTFPVRYTLYRISRTFIARRSFTDIRALTFGVPLDEYVGGDIEVKGTLEKPYFDSYELMVGKVLATEYSRQHRDESRFEFLWDEQALEHRLKESTLQKFVKFPLNAEQSRQLLALEERIKEYYGVSGFRHNMYYDNDAVIQGIAAFIGESVTDEMKPISSGTENDSAPVDN